MRKKLSFLSGLATVILFLCSFEASTFAAVNTGTVGSVSGAVYGSSTTGSTYAYGSGVTGNVYGNPGSGVTGNVYGNPGSGVTGNVYGNPCSGVTGNVYGNPGWGVTGNVYGNPCSGVTPSTSFVIDSASITPQTPVTAGDKVTVRIKAHNVKSGISTVTAEFNDPRGSNYMNIKSAELSLDPSTGDWVGTLYVGKNDMPGKWTLSQVWISDNAGYYTNVTVNPNSQASFTVVNPNADYTAPVIHSTKLSATSIHVGEKVTITSDITDDKSGVDSVNASLNNQQGGAYYYVPMRYDAATKKWVGTFEALDTTMPGQWNVDISAYDKAYNYTFFNPSSYSSPSFTVINLTGDYTSPVISNVQANKTDINAGDQITFTATVSDSQSGVGWVQGVLDNVGVIVFKKDSSTGKWVSTVTIPKNIPDGNRIGLENIHATDLKGNTTQSGMPGGGNPVYILVHNKTGDFTAPSLDDLQISSTNVKVGEQITFKAKVSDKQSGVKSVFGFLGNNANEITFSYVATSGLWVANYKIPSNLNSGQLELKVGFEDNTQNSNFINTGKYIKVNNLNGDTTAPVISNVKLTPSIVNAGAKLNVAATITDNQSGVRYVEAFAHSGSHFAEIPLSFDAGQNKWLGSYIVQSNDPSGTWEFDLTASDNFFNNKDYSSEFQVNNPNGDISAPYVDSFTESSRTAKVGDIVHFQTKLKDDQSGVKSAHLEIYTEDYYTFVSIPLSYDKTKGVWKADYTIPNYSTAGTHIIQIIADDNAGNEMREPAEQGLLIFNDHPDHDAPIVGGATVNLNKVAVGDTLEFKVKLNDSGSGVENAYVEPSFQGGTTGYDAGTNPISVPLAFDKKQNLWVGNYTIKSSDLPGTYTLNVYAKDNAGNDTTEWEDGSFTISIDKTAPSKPVVNAVTDKSTIVTGTAETGSTVRATIGTKTYTATVDGKGNYQVKIPQSKAGTTLTVTATDRAGNVSKAAVVTVLDKTAPSAPTINSVSDQTTAITGTAEAGSTVRITIGTKTYTAVVDGKGNYKLTITKQKAGTTLTVTATDRAGNVSKAAVVIVLDKTAPSVPTVNSVSDQTTSITGTAEAGSTVRITIGTKTYTAVVDGKGSYKLTIPKQKAGTTLTATAADKAGNVSKATVITVLDKTAPSAPAVNSVSDQTTTITGTAEAGSTVRVTIGTKTYTTTVDGKGNYKLAIPKQKAGTALTAKVADKAGNVSKAAVVTVLDKTAPSAPKVNSITNTTSVVTGSTEAYAVITIKAGNVVIGTGKADKSGTFKIKINVQKKNVVLIFTAQDASKNTSTVTKVNVK